MQTPPGQPIRRLLRSGERVESKVVLSAPRLSSLCQENGQTYFISQRHTYLLDNNTTMALNLGPAKKVAGRQRFNEIMAH